MTPVEAGTARLDLRLVPAALTSWAATAAGIIWPVGGSVLAVAVAVAATAVVGRWGSGRRESGADVAAVATGVVAVAVVGAGFAVAIGLRVGELRHHPIVERYGTVATVVVTPIETPRSLGGGRMMFRGSLQRVGGSEMLGRVVVFTRAVEFAELTAGRPASFRARIGRPTRRDLTVAVLSATGAPKLGEAAPIDRVAHDIRAGFADGARVALPADQAAMLPALVLGDTSTVTAQTTEEFRSAGLTHLTAVSGANVTIVCGAVLMTAALFGPRLAAVFAGLALVAFVIVVQPSASVLRAAVMGAMIVLAVFYLANGAYFLGVVQIIVYTGAIMMLFLFVVMLVGVTAADSLKETLKGQRWLAAACGLGFGVLLIAGIGNASLKHLQRPRRGQQRDGGNVEGLAQLIFTKYVFAFEITGALLITAAVGAMVLTHRERTERAKTQRELSEARVRAGKHAADPLPAPGVFARHNAVDMAGLLPDGTPSELTVSKTLRDRGQVREVPSEALNDLKALEQRAEERLGRDGTPRRSSEDRDEEEARR